MALSYEPVGVSIGGSYGLVLRSAMFRLLQLGEDKERLKICRSARYMIPSHALGFPFELFSFGDIAGFPPTYTCT